jgi:hypothetical protein
MFRSLFGKNREVASDRKSFGHNPLEGASGPQVPRSLQTSVAEKERRMRPMPFRLSADHAAVDGKAPDLVTVHINHHDHWKEVALKRHPDNSWHGFVPLPEKLTSINYYFRADGVAKLDPDPMCTAVTDDHAPESVGGKVSRKIIRY